MMDTNSNKPIQRHNLTRALIRIARELDYLIIKASINQRISIVRTGHIVVARHSLEKAIKFK